MPTNMYKYMCLYKKNMFASRYMQVYMHIRKSDDHFSQRAMRKNIYI